MAFRVPGPITVSWDSQDLGKFKEGAIIRTETFWQPVVDDEHGDEPATHIFAGKSATVEIIGLSMASFNAAEVAKPNLWLGGLWANTNAVGALLSSYGKVLTITEFDTSTWVADLSQPMDPAELILSSTQEIALPVLFLIIPTATGELFSTHQL